MPQRARGGPGDAHRSGPSRSRAARLLVRATAIVGGARGQPRRASSPVHLPFGSALVSFAYLRLSRARQHGRYVCVTICWQSGRHVSSVHDAYNARTSVVEHCMHPCTGAHKATAVAWRWHKSCQAVRAPRTSHGEASAAPRRSPRKHIARAAAAAASSVLHLMRVARSGCRRRSSAGEVRHRRTHMGGRCGARGVARSRQGAA